jgi:hypothetical protein
MCLKFAAAAAVLALVVSIITQPANGADPIDWRTDYGAAMKEAKAAKRMMFLYFPKAEKGADSFESSTLQDANVRGWLTTYVPVKLPLNYSVTVSGKSSKLLAHAAFAELHGGAGVAVVDCTNSKSPHYGHVVSIIPFGCSLRLGAFEMSHLLALPPGSLTQRTMILAVRIHPERPASTAGEFHPVLAAESASHSIHQASISNQGHHQWDYRFNRINSQLPGTLAQEVVAESWPNQGLVDACVECVSSWRQSPGHWGAVRGRHRFFGYDIKRGGNGIWYATGIFARH